MSLNLAQLEKVRKLEGGIVQARCPACAEGGHDRTGEHLLVYPDGKFGCCVHPKDREHRKRIFALAGCKEQFSPPRDIKVRVAGKVSGAVQPGILGRLGRVFQSPNALPKTPDAADGVGEVQTPTPAATAPLAEVRTPRTGLPKSNGEAGETACLVGEETRTARTGVENPYACSKKESGNNIVRPHKEFAEGVRSVRAAEPPFEAQETVLESDSPVRGVRAPEATPNQYRRVPHLTPGGDLVIPFDGDPKYHYWKPGGQPLALTLAEVRAGLIKEEEEKYAVTV